MANADLMTYYLVLTGATPQNPYKLDEGYVIRAVVPQKKLFKGFSSGLPSHSAILGLGWKGEKFPESYFTYRDLIIFHSFVSDDTNAFEFATELAIKHIRILSYYF